MHERCMNPSTGSRAREESPLSAHEYVDDVQLWLKLGTDTDWIVTLTIPTEEFNQFTFRPLSWLRFLGFAIYGREGALLLSPEGEEVDDYTVSTESLKGAYYYSSNDEPRLVDVQGMNDRISDFNSVNSESHDEFARRIVGRDETCVMSRQGSLLCDASHLIPRSKGDEYIKRVTELRKNNDDDVIDSIDDPRNGLLLGNNYHRLLGRGYLAFLKVIDHLSRPCLCIMLTGSVDPDPKFCFKHQ